MEKEKIIERLIRREAEITHRNFLQQMHPYFGLSAPPEPIVIEIERKLHLSDAVYTSRGHDDLILIGCRNAFKYSGSILRRVAIHSIAHETAHYLQFLYHKEKFGQKNMYRWGHKKKEIAREMVVELGNHAFFRQKGAQEEYLDVIREFEYGEPALTHEFFGGNPLERELEILSKVSIQPNFSTILHTLEEEGFNSKDLHKRWKSITR